MVELNGKLRLHPQFTAETVYVGIEGLPVLVVDNFLGDPDILVEYAAVHGRFDSVSDAFYPGCRAPIPPIYCFAVRAFLGEYIARTFNLQLSDLTGEVSHFSLITTAPARLNLVQRMLHFDNTNPKQLAVLHYLCGGHHGGTSFYRHRRTHFESIDETRKLSYAQAVSEELSTLGPPPMRYICGDDPMYIRTAAFPAACNRVLIYQSVNLHSADIQPGFVCDPHPRTGRLTANTFFYYR